MNENVIAPGMYKVRTSQIANTNKAKSVLSSTGLSGTSSVRRSSDGDSSFKDSVVSNTKNSAEKVEVSDRTNKKLDVASKNVALHTVRSNVRRALFTTPRTVKSRFKDTTLVVSKTRFSVRTVQSKSLDTNPVVSKAKIDAGTPLSDKNKVSSALTHMTGDRSLLKNFVEKYMGTVRFGNDHFAAITGYGDYVHGNITIFHVNYVERLEHNLFSVGQFCDGDIEVGFHSQSCYVRNLEGDDLLTRARESNLYTISIPDMASYLPVCLMSEASFTKSWLWHRRHSHLNFGTINDLTKHNLVDGILKINYGKDYLCYPCERGKSKKASHLPKLVSSSYSKLELIYMDICGPMRVASINGKKYILMIVMILDSHGKSNVGFFHVFGFLCYPTNNRDDLGKMNPKADIESMNTPSKEDLDNLFGPMFDEYFEKKSSDMPINSTAPHVHNHEDPLVQSSIDINEHEVPPIVTTSKEQSSPIPLIEGDEL
nr:putative ribonuclease H-like domain-containing protein [Tanacetum cinerariifolium]